MMIDNKIMVTSKMMAMVSIAVVLMTSTTAFFAPIKTLGGRSTAAAGGSSGFTATDFTAAAGIDRTCLQKPSWVEDAAGHSLPAAASRTALHVAAIEPPSYRRVGGDDEDDGRVGSGSGSASSGLEKVESRVKDASEQIREKARETRERVKSRLANVRERVQSATLSFRSDYIKPAVRLAQNPVVIQYDVSMAVRLSYFMMQDGVISTTVDRRVNLHIPAVVRAVLGAIANGREEDLLESLRTFDERVTSTESYAWWRKNLRGIITLLRKEASDIENGVYKFPLDMAPNRGEALTQANPAALLALSAAYWQQQRKLKANTSESDKKASSSSDFIAPGRYPDYYLDGPNYLSATKAEVMDYEADSLLWGMADAVRRRSLAKIDVILADKDPENTKLLDVGCGSGRFLTFVKDNFKQLKVTAMDLSLFNLIKAKKSLKAYSGVTFLEGNAETMPLPTESMDIVTCNFVLSEVPLEAQVSIINEMARTLKPGGRLIIVDGTQTEFDQDSYGSGSTSGGSWGGRSGSSSGSSGGAMSTVSRMEGEELCTLDGLPHFKATANYHAYTFSDLEYLLIKAGLFIQDKEISWVSKMIVAQKPPLITPVIGDDHSGGVGVGY